MGGIDFHKKTIRDIPLRGQTILVRTGFDVPLNEDGSVADDLRIRASLPTLRYLLKQGCKVVIMAHLGRPEGKDKKYSLEPAAQRLAELVHEPVRFVNQTVGDKVRLAIKRAPRRSLIILENLRFESGEKENSQDFAKQLVRDTGARYLVQDAFSNAHREDASMAAITLEVPSVAGLLLEQEWKTLTEAIEAPKRPLVAVMGGAKVSDKISVIESFVKKADQILIGGAMANTFLSYKGFNVGKSKYEPDEASIIESIYTAVEKNVGKTKVDDFLKLPTDVAVATSIDEKSQRRSVAVDKLNSDDMALDIGDETIEAYSNCIANAKTVIWNGTLGYAEHANFAHGSARLALAMALNKDLTTIIGGGDTADFIRDWDVRAGGSFSHVSTGGGASLELLAGKKLPGIEHLLDA